MSTRARVDVTQDGGIGAGAVQRQISRPNTDYRGREQVSGKQAFPHSLLSMGEAGVATPNQLNHFAIISMISEKRRQRNALYAFVVRKFERFKQKADKAGFLEEDDVKRAKDAVNEAKEDVKKHKSAIMAELDNLKCLIHGDLTVNINPSEHFVQSNVNKMKKENNL